MDLHDYKDVAKNYDRYLEAMYSEFDNHEGFQKFYLKLAEKYGRDGVVDIACGTKYSLAIIARSGFMHLPSP